jgi:putative endonuclease
MIKRTIKLPSANNSPSVDKTPPVSTNRHEPDPKRVAAFHNGLSAESRAAMILVAKGYRILARRFRSSVGEIDIVAGRRHTLVFVEVKARVTYSEAVEAVTEQQRRRIVAAAEFWLAKRPHDGDIRFDVIVVTPGRIPQHLQSAFDAST